MTDTPPANVADAYWKAKVEQIEADARQSRAEGLKAEKEARLYPWIAIISSAGLMVAAGAFGTFLANLAMHR